MSAILSSIFLILALHSSFLTTSFFTTLHSLLKSAGVVSNFPISNLSTLLLNCLNHQEQFLICLHLFYQPQFLN